MKTRRNIIQRLLNFSKKQKIEVEVKGFTTNNEELFIAFQNNETTCFFSSPCHTINDKELLIYSVSKFYKN